MKYLVKYNKKTKTDDGFSLLELVVAVGILLVLTVGGLLAYNGIINSARQAAVENAAETVYNQAMIYKTDNNSNTTIQTAVDNWNESAGVKLPEGTAAINVMGAIGVNDEKINVTATDLENDSFEIKAVYGDEDSDSKVEATRTSVPLRESGEITEETGSAVYSWGSASFVCESQDRETYDLDGRIATKYTHEVSIPFTVNDESFATGSSLFITINDNNYYPGRWGGAAEFVSVNDAFTYREDMSGDGQFVFEVNDANSSETLTFEYKDNFYCDRDLTATMSIDDSSVKVPEPLSHGALYQGM